MPRIKDPLVVGRVIGDVLDQFTRSVSLSVTYNNNIEVSTGFTFEPSQVVNQPRVGIRERVGIDEDNAMAFYTLVMVDPDAPNPSEPSAREYLHWLVTNIPAGSEAGEGHEVVSYESPRPALGIHRLVFILFRQEGGRETICAPGWRQNFITRDFTEVYNLGPPLAASYFNCPREIIGSGDQRRR